MNYAKIYNALIERAQNRELDGYVERHHIVPRCMGGTDDRDNLVSLTPEEHYVAHQLLVKMYPNAKGLTWAAIRMTHHSTNNRSTNKLYGWLKRRHSEYSKTRVGDKNPSWGKHWFHNPETGETIKTELRNKPEGWLKGKRSVRCQVCGEPTRFTRHKYCDKHREQGRLKSKSAAAIKENKPKAEDLWQQFLDSEFDSVTSFAKSIGTSQPRLTQLWNKYIPDYQKNKRHGRSFKEVDTGS